MKKTNRLNLSILIQSLPVFILVLSVIFGQTNADLFTTTLSLLFLIQCFDALNIYPAFRGIIKYFLISVVFVFLFAFLFNNMTYGGEYNALLGFLLGFIWVAVIILILISIIFVPVYFLGTIAYQIYILQIKIKGPRMEESNILDDHFLNNAA